MLYQYGRPVRIDGVEIPPCPAMSQPGLDLPFTHRIDNSNGVYEVRYKMAGAMGHISIHSMRGADQDLGDEALRVIMETFDDIEQLSPEVELLWKGDPRQDQNNKCQHYAVLNEDTPKLDSKFAEGHAFRHGLPFVPLSWGDCYMYLGKEE